MYRIFTVALSALILLAFTGCGQQEKAAAKIFSFSGDVAFKARSDAQFAPAAANAEIIAGGAVRTSKESEASLQLTANKANIRIYEDTFFEVRAENSLGFQSSGKAVYDVNKQEKEIMVETTHGNTAVLGTRFAQIVKEDSFELWVEKGEVEFTSKNGQKRRVSAGKNIRWDTAKPLPEASEHSFVDSEAIFGTGQGSFDFNRR